MPQTIQQCLRSGVQRLQPDSDSAQLDAEILLAHAIQQNRTYLRTWPERSLTDTQLHQFENLISQRERGVPIAHLVGYKDFWKHTFLVSKDVLIPRPETELLIEQALQFCPAEQTCLIADLGTGSGAIALSLALERPQCTVHATDASAKALALAQRNAIQLGADSVQFHLSNWFDDFDVDELDLIVSNPPYIAPDDPHLHTGDVRFEPRQALVAENQGLSDLKQIIDQAWDRLKFGGRLMLEHGYDQSEAVQTLMAQRGYIEINTIYDLQGHPRVTSGQRPN